MSYTEAKATILAARAKREELMQGLPSPLLVSLMMNADAESLDTRNDGMLTADQRSLHATAIRREARKLLSPKK